MEEKDKILVRIRLAATLRRIFRDNQKLNEKNKALDLADGVRSLETATGLSYTIIQGIYAASRDIQLTSLMVIITEGLEMTFSSFARTYDSITDEEILSTQKEILTSKKK